MLCVPPEDVPAFAALLVHEIQHSKLAVLFDAMPLYRRGGTARHRVAWRADPRPVHAVLQGTYAHLGLADLWHRVALRDDLAPSARNTARARREGYREQVGAALALLRETGELTPEGTAFSRGMAHHHAALGNGVRKVYY
ncbi:hypothetical protein SRB5_38120 [Streptomyces sp. RB5]|uniref:HEXXH motif domain-containing protein n=1 Tax=Streptomyces smaragdinus TaxID=2585196 RepID=A0A7K0CKZ3_9ACTN|nr:hypothetical protein [Streptomyces smaragdinus]